MANSKNPITYSTDQVSQNTGIPAHILVYWTQYFSLPITYSDLGIPRYTSDDQCLFICIHSLLKENISMNTIKGLIPDLLRMKTIVNLNRKSEELRRDLFS